MIADLCYRYWFNGHGHATLFNLYTVLKGTIIFNSTFQVFSSVYPVVLNLLIYQTFVLPDQKVKVCNIKHLLRQVTEIF